jgi:hypothetical protein
MNMKLSKNTILSIALLALVAIAWGYQGPYQRWQHKRKLPVNFMKLDGEINRFEIESGKTKISLAKEGDNWRVYGQEGKFFASPIQMKSITQTLNGLGNLELEVASNNPKKQEDFMVTGDNVLKITLKSDKGEAKFNVGKSTANFNGSYVGHEGDSNTYRLNSTNLQQLLGRKEWRDYSLFNLDFKQPIHLRLQYPDHETKMTLRDEEWLNDKGGIKYNKEQIDKVASTLVSLVAVEIPKQDFKPTGLQKPKMIIQFSGDGFDETLMLGNKGPKNTYYAKKASSDNIYLINSTDFDTLTQKERKPVPEPKEPKK